MKIERNYGLDLLKFLANIGILFHHYQQVTSYSFNYYLDFYHGFFYWGYLVELFFCISGFFSIRYSRKIKDGLGFESYILHKLWRFVPMLLICESVYVIALFFYHRMVPPTFWSDWGHLDKASDLWKFLTGVLCMNFGGMVNPDNGFIDGVTWTLSVLVICYVWLYLIEFISNQIGINVCYLYGLMVLMGIAIQEYGINAPFFNIYTGRGYCAFFSGLCISLYLNRAKIVIPLYQKMLLMCILSIATVLSTGQEYLLAIIIYPLVIIVFTDDKIERFFRHFGGLFHFLGNVGFEMYIWHPIVIIIMLIISHLTGMDFEYQGMIKMVLFAVCCFVIGTFAYWFIERPLSRIYKK